MATIGQQLVLLCLFLGKVYSYFPDDDKHTVDGTVSHNVTLPCSFTIPDNWRDSDIEIMWFQNFKDKLLNCTVREGRSPICWKVTNSFRTHISWDIFGNADLQISNLQESDSGPYQCWIILPDAYRRQDTFLRVNGVRSNDPGKNVSPLHGFGQWNALVDLTSWNTFLMSSWLLPIFLVIVVLAQKSFNNYRKRRCTVIKFSSV
ncbi:uncharacterized protein LOC142098581 [Mixophyes fleayi]|uniref:uncharacterized protein LOC142098581 n=1 Tax=Mixophyes fleayi TaxID=3061075 RepID=UPI003F4DE17D